MSEPKPWTHEQHIEEILRYTNTILEYLTKIETTKKMSLKDRIRTANSASIVVLGLRVQANALKEKLKAGKS